MREAGVGLVKHPRPGVHFGLQLDSTESVLEPLLCRKSMKGFGRAAEI
jgi:hypothetical protein